MMLPDPQSHRPASARALATIPDIRLVGSLSQLPSAFELARDRKRQGVSGKIGIYSHPGYWRAQFNDEISAQVGKAQTPADYHEQNPRVESYLSRRTFGGKYLLHEQNFQRFLELSAITGTDIILSIPCKRKAVVNGENISLVPADGGAGHFSNWINLRLMKLRELFPASLNSAMRLGKIAFYPTNASNGKFCSALVNLMESTPALREEFSTLTDVIAKGLVIPGGGLTHVCAEQTLQSLGVKTEDLFPVQELLYTDDPNEGADGQSFSSCGLFRSVFPSLIRKARLVEFLTANGQTDGMGFRIGE